MSEATNFKKTRPGQITIQKSIIYFILGLALIRGLIYAAVVPPWQAPDEPSQFERTKAALTTEDWYSTSENRPAWYDELRDSLVTFQFLNYTLVRLQNTPQTPLNHYIDLYHEIYEGTYGSRLTYAIIGLPLFLAPHQEITLQLYLVRLNMVFMGVVTIFLAYLTTQAIFPNDSFLALEVPVLILFNPQHTHIISTVNNGNLAELLATAALYFIVRGFMQGFSILNVVLALGFSLVAIWTKATAYFLLVTIASIGLLYLWQYRRHWRWGLSILILLIGLAYYLIPDRLSLLIFAVWLNLTGGQFYLNPIVISDIFRSFWAMPGWAILRLNPLWYQILLIICALALSGLIILLIKKWHSLFSKQFQPQQVQTLIILAISIGAAIAIQVGWHILTGTLFYKQGRSIYPVIVPLAIFLILGWRQLIPLTWQKPALMAMTVGFFLFDSTVLFSYLIPFFYSRY